MGFPCFPPRACPAPADPAPISAPSGSFDYIQKMLSSVAKSDDFQPVGDGGGEGVKEKWTRCGCVAAGVECIDCAGRRGVKGRGRRGGGSLREPDAVRALIAR